MNKINIPIIGAVITALLSTLCCLPAFLFIFFGISSGVLTFFTELDFLRIPMVIITFVLLFFGVKRFKKKISCKCTKKQRVLQITFVTIFFSLIFFLLLYPELIPILMD